MAQLPLTGPFAEADLGDQLRPHPMHPRAGESPDRERRLVLLQRGQPPPEALEQLVVETGPDLAGVDQVVALPVAEQQSAEAVPGPLRVGVAADHQLLLVGALELQPVARPPGRVGRVGPLGDHALPALAAGLPPVGLAVGVAVGGEPEGVVKRQQAPQHGLALPQLQASQVVAGRV
jgi:hypothetical protein